MMCWESLDDSEQASKKRKTHAEDVIQFQPKWLGIGGDMSYYAGDKL